MTSWPQAIASFYLGGTVLLLLLLNNLSERGSSTASEGIVVVSALGLILGVVATVVRLILHARAVRHPEVTRRRPLSEPVDPRRAATWAAVGAAGLLLIALAHLLAEDRTVRLTLLFLGVVLAGLSYWRLWWTPLRPIVPPGTEDELRGTRSRS